MLLEAQRSGSVSDAMWQKQRTRVQTTRFDREMSNHPGYLQPNDVGLTYGKGSILRVS